MKEVYLVVKYSITGREYKGSAVDWTSNMVAARKYDTYGAAQSVIKDIIVGFPLGTMFGVFKAYIL